MFETKKISVEQVKEMIEKDEKVVLLDVRSEEEFAEGHIDGAINIPLQKLSYEVEYEIEDKEEMIILYCRSGVRTIQAAMILEELGYTNVHDMGGIISWPYKIIK